MLNKVVFLCASPWENFLSSPCRGNSKKYYHWVKETALSRAVNVQCREYIDIYGAVNQEREKIFSENQEDFQLVYVQSDRKELLEKIFKMADLVIMGVPGSRREFDKIYMSVFPWKDEIMFLWNSRICRDSNYISRLVSECMLRKEQFIEIKKLPYDTGAQNAL